MSECVCAQENENCGGLRWFTCKGHAAFCLCNLCARVKAALVGGGGGKGDKGTVKARRHTQARVHNNTSSFSFLVFFPFFFHRPFYYIVLPHLLSPPFFSLIAVPEDTETVGINAACRYAGYYKEKNNEKRDPSLSESFSYMANRTEIE